jgi:CheY-like chemotaxis protein
MEDGQFTSGDLIYIAQNIADSDVPIVVEGTNDFKELIKENGNGKERRISYIDSSIWLRYVNENDPETLKNIEKEFREYYELGLYKTSRAQENREFNSRLLRNSRLIDFGGGHGGDVVPFVFHSESIMKEMYKDVRRRFADILKIVSDHKIKWRVLIVDDHATELTAEDVCKKRGIDNAVISKCKIIQYWFSDMGFKLECGIDGIFKKENCKNISNCSCHCGLKTTFGKDEQCYCEKNPNKFPEDIPQLIVQLECVETLDKAKEKLQTKKYDLILLDYLMKEQKGNKYSYQLLSEIKDVFDEEAEKNQAFRTVREDWLGFKNIKKDYSEEDLNKLIKQKKGSGGRFHFLFMSAFVNAVNNRMLQLRLLPHTSYWDFGSGACPTTTPNLFKYYLLKTMYDQVCEITRLHEVPNNKITLIDLLSITYFDKNTARQNAISFFNALLKMRLNYDTLKYDIYIDEREKEGKMKEENRSLLALSLFPDTVCYNNAFWEHITHLFYLTAYGTIRQWHDMWDEFMLVKNTLINAEKACHKVDVIKKIEKYICSLQNSTNQ